MDVKFTCPVCGKKLALDDRHIGREVCCPFCNSVFLFNSEMVEHMAPRQAFPVGMASSHNYQKSSRDTVTFDVRPIGFWARVVAAIVDAIVSTIVAVVVAVLAGLFLGIFGGDAELTGRIIGIITSWLYCALMEASSVQATLGKLVIGARVVDANGERVSFGRASGRHFAKYISLLIFCIGYVMVAFDERKRGLHDMIAGTYVVSRK